MTEQPQPLETVRRMTHLRRDRTDESSWDKTGELSPQMRLLRQWQSQRLATTYADLLQNPRYEAAGQFFLKDLYSARDFRQRDEDIQHVYHVMRSVLPPEIARSLEGVVELNDLTRRLDEALLKALVDELGVTDSITPEQYAEAYRICQNYPERVRQIELIMEIGRRLEKLVRRPLVATTLRLARGPAHLVGYGELQEFLERGFVAFKQMRGAEEFLLTIGRREREILDRIYAHHPEPFADLSIPLDQ